MMDARGYRNAGTLALAFASALVTLHCSVADRGSVDGSASSPGVKTTLLPSKGTPIVYFRILFRTGSMDDPAGKEGLAALTARMLGEGGTRTLTYSEVLDALYPMAAQIGVQADKEVVVITGQCHRDHLNRFYPILRDAVLDPRFDGQDFDRLRDEAENYLINGLRGNDDENLGKWALQLALYPNHPYGHVDAGTVQGLKSITLDDVRRFYKSHFTRDTVDVGLAGGYGAGLVSRVTADFKSGLGSGKPTRPVLPAPHFPRKTEILMIRKPCIATAISAGFPTQVSRSDADWYPLLLANSYLGEHRTFNGVLMNELRGKRGLNYGDYAYIENFIQEGGTTFPLPGIPRRQQYFSFWLRPVPHQSALFALRAALYYVDRLVREGISEEDFEHTRSFLKTYSRLWAQNLDQRLGYLQDSTFYGVPDYLAEVQERLRTMTRDQVNAAIRKHLQAENFVVVLVTEEAESALRTLESGSPTPMHYDTPGTPADVLAEDKAIERFSVQVNRERSRIVSAQELFER
jgi:zinc protease